jgi:hypothetical protein
MLGAGHYRPPSNGKGFLLGNAGHGNHPVVLSARRRSGLTGTPVELGSRFGDWSVCWLGGWSRHRLYYLVMLVKIEG